MARTEARVVCENIDRHSRRYREIRDMADGRQLAHGGDEDEACKHVNKALKTLAGAVAHPSRRRGELTFSHNASCDKPSLQGHTRVTSRQCSLECLGDTTAKFLQVSKLSHH